TVRLGLQPASLASEPWTILTSLFIHANLGHILGNMITLYFFGTYLSILVGKRDFLITYFIGGLLGNAFFLIYELYAPGGNPYVLGIGASGAIFALGGALAVLRPMTRVSLFFIIPMPLWVGVIGGFLIMSLVPDVSWQAHLGGLVAGLIAGYFFRLRERRGRT
ncbi:MAG: rhomboid family intramembrane serine protease, partial [Chloroflexi bacterium]|nr:rhomboid family intramembrane serine protease [Chloroflexota bacterium]